MAVQTTASKKTDRTSSAATPNKYRLLAKELDIKLQFNPNNAFELTITVPAKTVKSYQTRALKNLAQAKTVKGFRKGKAPLNLIKSQVGDSELKETTLSLLLPDAYLAGLVKHQLQPIIDPQLTQLTTDKPDWQLTFVSSTKPNIRLNNYRTKLKTASLKTSAKIWTPKDGAAKQQTDPQQSQKEKLDLAIQTVLAEVEVELADILIETENNKALSDLIDQTAKLGMTIESYAAAKNLTVDELKRNTRRQTEMSLKLEFALPAIAEDLGIKVTDSELTKLWRDSSPQSTTPMDQRQKQYLASVLIRQKTIDKLISLIGN